MITKFYVQFVPEWGYHDRLRTIKAARVTQLRPGKTVPNAVVIRLEVDLPESLFKPLIVTAVVNDTTPDELVADADLEKYDYDTEGLGGT
jgi:hypothetical protein